MDVFIDAVGGRLYHIGVLDVQLVAVGEEGIGIVLCNLHDRLVLPAGTLEHLVFAGVGIGSQMSHVGDIHYPLDRIALIAQRLFQHILHDVAAQVADVGIVIHRGAAGVHLHQIRVIGNKAFFFMGCRVIKVHIFFLLDNTKNKRPSCSR